MQRWIEHLTIQIKDLEWHIKRQSNGLSFFKEAKMVREFKLINEDGQEYLVLVTDEGVIDDVFKVYDELVAEEEGEEASDNSDAE